MYNPYQCHVHITQVDEVHTLFDKIRQSFQILCLATAVRLKDPSI